MCIRDSAELAAPRALFVVEGRRVCGNVPFVGRVVDVEPEPGERASYDVEQERWPARAFGVVGIRAQHDRRKRDLFGGGHTAGREDRSNEIATATGYVPLHHEPYPRYARRNCEQGNRQSGDRLEGLEHQRRHSEQVDRRVVHVTGSAHGRRLTPGRSVQVEGSVRHGPYRGRRSCRKYDGSVPCCFARRLVRDGECTRRGRTGCYGQPVS